jgi:uncharacterized protein (TIGR02569 family)
VQIAGLLSAVTGSTVLGMPAPPDAVLAAFGVAGHRAEPLDGGLNVSWRAGDLVLKQADLDMDELAWQARLLPRVRCDGFRLAPWVAAGDGSLCVDGWCAMAYVAGRHELGRWAEIVAAGERLHAALTGVPRPPFLDSRSSPWAIADRVACGETPLSATALSFAGIPHMARLAAAVRPVRAPSQLIHGDLAGNVLFDDRLPPAIIDLSAYWRPVGYASAMVIGDALVWEGADADILGAVGHIGGFGQYLVRALIFRLVADSLLAQDWTGRADLGRWELAVGLACDLAAARR